MKSADDPFDEVIYTHTQSDPVLIRLHPALPLPVILRERQWKAGGGGIRSPGAPVGALLVGAHM